METEKIAEYYGHDRPELLEFFPQNFLTVLEVGCGAGAFSASIKKRTPKTEVWGIEPSSHAITAKTRLDRVFQMTFEDAFSSLPAGYFDCVVFNDVLEHLVEPEATIAKLKVKLKSCGFVFASIPNVREFNNLKELLLQKDWRYRNHGILDSTHLRFFTKKSIIRMFENNGYEVTLCEDVGVGKKRRIVLNVLNLLLFNLLSDSYAMQYAVLARLKNS